MAKIFLAGPKVLSPFEDSLINSLIASHDVLFFNLQIGGYDWEAAIRKSIELTDITVVLINEIYCNKKNFHDELSYLISYIKEFNDKFFIPIVIGNIDIPSEILEANIFSIKLDDDNSKIEQYTNLINQKILSHIGSVAAKEEIALKKNKQIEIKADEYVAQALELLKIREDSFSKSAKLWYWLGYGSIGFAIILSVILTCWGYYQIYQKSATWELIAFSTIKSLIIVGLLIALAKYSFTLAKSFMDESLKNSDRIHAISFGQFFLRAFGQQADIATIKDVFQHWNISAKNSFSTLDSEFIEPKVIALAFDLAKVLAEKNIKK